MCGGVIEFVGGFSRVMRGMGRGVSGAEVLPCGAGRLVWFGLRAGGVSVDGSVVASIFLIAWGGAGFNS